MNFSASHTGSDGRCELHGSNENNENNGNNGSNGNNGV